MRVAPCVCLMIVSLGLASCSSLKKSGGSAGAAAPRGEGRVKGSEPAAPPPGPFTGGQAPPAGVNGVLAGQVIDGYQRRLTSSVIQVVETDGGRAGAPIEVPVDNQGYFTINGLQAGKRYQLTARARAGSQPLAGSTWATPPDPKLVIRLTDDIAPPPAPSAAAWPPPGSEPPPPNWGNTPTPGAEPARAPGNSNGWSAPGANRGRPAELGPPVGTKPAPPPPPPPSRPLSLENIADGKEKDFASRESVPGLIPSQGPNNNQPTPSADAVAAIPRGQPIASPPMDPGPARVPSCVLTGQTLHNFALNDLNGRPWEFRYHRGRIVLIDFWGTWCIPCLHSIPHLNILQDRYGSYGLEVIGIAYEGGTPLEQARKVNDVRQRLRINYQLLLGSDRSQCPVKTQFGVSQFPTLVLLDEKGRIIWRGEGLDGQRARDLDIIIRQRLGLQ